MEAVGGDVIALESEQLVFYESAPALLEMALFKIALEVWYNTITRVEFNREAGALLKCDILTCAQLELKYKDKLFRAVKSLELPKPIEERIGHCLRRIHVKMVECTVNFSGENFGYNLRKYRITDFDPAWWVWSVNGEIDVERSVSKIVSAAELTEVQKFILMCDNRLVDQMKTISLCSLPADFIDEVDFQHNPVVFYCIRHLRNELHEIPLGRFASIDDLMARRCRDTNLPWFEYFWDRLGVDDQISVAIPKFRDSSSTRYLSQYQKKLMSKMNGYQQRRLCSEIPARIVLNFWHNDDVEWAFAVWMRLKGQFTKRQFVDLVGSMVYWRTWSEKAMGLLIDIWNTAADHLKYYFVDSRDGGVISAFRRYTYRSLRFPAPSSFKFLYELFSLQSTDSRKETMLSIANYLATSFVDSLIMTDVLRLCWPDDDELLKFKKLVMNASSTREEGVRLVGDLQFERLYVVFTIYSPNESVTRDFVKGVFESSDVKIAEFILCREKWVELSKFIDKIYTTDCGDSSASLNVKKQFIFSFAANDRYHWNDDHCLDELSIIVESVLEPDELKSFKQTLLNCICDVSDKPKYWETFNEKYFCRVLSWCLGDEANVVEFKSTLHIDDIFRRFLRELCNIGQDTHDLMIDNLNRFLIWYFASVEEAKKYKILRLYDRDTDLLIKMHRRYYSANEWKNILQRLFDNDSQEADKFQRKLALLEPEKSYE